MNRDLEAFWRGLSEGREQEAVERYADARRRARTLGRDYAETAEPADRSTLEALERLEKLERREKLMRGIHCETDDAKSVAS